MRYIGKLTKAFGGGPVFTTADVRRLFRSASRAYVDLMLHNLARAKRLFRLAKGVYSFHGDAQLVGFAFPPFYYGCEDALSLHGLWEQETNTVVITPRKVRSGTRKFDGTNYLVRRICRKMFFGYETMKCGEFWVPVSTVEKTLIDLVYFRVHIPKEVLAGLRKRIDKKRLAELLAKCPSKLKKRVNRNYAK